MKTENSRLASEKQQRVPMKHVALFGGSFNPPHVGHLMAALYVRAVRAVDEVWLVPAFTHPFGKSLLTFEDRITMCELMCRDVGAWLSVSRAESEVGGDGRTIELLDHLIPKHPGTHFLFVIGSDILGDLPKWKAWNRIERMVEVVVLHRAGYPSPRAEGPPLPDVSSTEIRRLFAKGELPRELVPRPVLQFLLQKRPLTWDVPTQPPED